MNPEEAKLILQCRRPCGQDDHDPAVSEALALIQSDAAPHPSSDKDAKAVWRSPKGHRLIFDDASPGKLTLVHRDRFTKVELTDKETILQSNKDITFEAATGKAGLMAKKISVAATNAIKLKATTSVGIASITKTTLGGGSLGLQGPLQLNPGAAASVKPASAKGAAATKITKDS